MSAMTAAAVRLSDGRRVALGNLVDIEVQASIASPAMSLRCVAAVDAFPGELGRVTAACGGETLFEGAVDRQVSSLSEGGRLLTVEARSKGAALLDNQAMPCDLGNVYLSAVFRLYAQPYGFALYNPQASRRLARYTVPGGLTEWEALTGFTRLAYGVTPHVRGDLVIVERPMRGAALRIGGEGLPYCSVEQAHEPYRMLSRVVLRDQGGNYSSAVHNSAAAYYGVQRKRYIIPPGEFAGDGAADANERIRQSMRDARAVTVTLPGYHRVTPGQEARVEDAVFRLYNLLVETVRWRQSARGLTTTLELADSV